MKIPEIDPELHGLLDEVVTDPRSALRRTPRRALLQWFGNPDSAHARPIDATTAERHLVAVYRESLAEIFRESALVAYYRAPLHCFSRRSSDGRSLAKGPTVADLRMKSQKAADFGVAWARGPAQVSRLLELCQTELPDGPASEWASLSVALAPTEFGRFIEALTLPVADHLRAIGLLQRLTVDSRAPHGKKDVHNQLGLRMAGVGWTALAREQYESAIHVAPESPEAVICAFNLACFLQDEASALRHSRGLESSLDLGDERLGESVVLLSKWARDQAPHEVMRAKKLSSRLSGRFSPQALIIAGAL